MAQEHAITASGLPYSIVRATQFEEFTTFVIVWMLDGETVRVPDALIQPISSEHVAAEVVRVALGTPLNRFEDIGGPAKLSFAELARRVRGSGTTIVVDPAATYFGATLTTTSLVVTD
jgi:uncharacterized protein YbjT (DUF2867 family)